MKAWGSRQSYSRVQGMEGGQRESCSNTPLHSATDDFLTTVPVLQESVPLGEVYDHYPSLFPSHFALKK